MMSKIFKQMLSGCLLVVISQATFAFSWQDLWVTKDKQAEALMAKEQFNEAQTLFQAPDWQAVAAFRAKNYERAAKGFEALNTEKGYYNQGNALAHMGKYEAAIKAYDKALNINPSNEDALFNRKLVESLLQKEKQQQNSSSKDNKSGDKQNNPPDQSSSNKDNNNQTDQNQDNANKQNAGQNKNQETQNQPDENQQDKDKSSKPEKSKQKKQDNADKDSKSEADEADKKDKDKSKADKSTTATDASSEEEREKQQAKDQWLRLIPDDPGGLMREKFLRDYIKRQRGWYQ